MPGKPFVSKVEGRWMVLIPHMVFDGQSSGTCHGPFPCWQIAFSAAVAIAGATLLNVRAINTQPMKIRSVN